MFIILIDRSDSLIPIYYMCRTDPRRSIREEIASLKLLETDRLSDLPSLRLAHTLLSCLREGSVNHSWTIRMKESFYPTFLTGGVRRDP